jgi:hypothetical protein
VLVGRADHRRIGGAVHDDTADQRAHPDRRHMVPLCAAARERVQWLTARVPVPLSTARIRPGGEPTLRFRPGVTTIAV